MFVIQRKQKISKSHQLVDVKDIPNTEVQKGVSYCQQPNIESIELDCENVSPLIVSSVRMSVPLIVSSARM